MLSWNTVLLYPRGVAERLDAGRCRRCAFRRAGSTRRRSRRDRAPATRFISSRPADHARRLAGADRRGRCARSTPDQPLAAAAHAQSAFRQRRGHARRRTISRRSTAGWSTRPRRVFGANHYRHYDWLLTLSDQRRALRTRASRVERRPRRASDVCAKTTARKWVVGPAWRTSSCTRGTASTAVRPAWPRGTTTSR